MLLLISKGLLVNTVPSITLHSLNINFFFFHNTHTSPHRSQWIGVLLFLPFFLYFHFRLEFYYCIRNGFTFFIIFIWGGCIFPFFYNVTFTLFSFLLFFFFFLNQFLQIVFFFAFCSYPFRPC